MPADIEDKLRQVSGIESIDAMRYVNARSGENSVLVVVRNFVGKPTDFFDLVDRVVADARLFGDGFSGWHRFGLGLCRRGF